MLIQLASEDNAAVSEGRTSNYTVSGYHSKCNDIQKAYITS